MSVWALGGALKGHSTKWALNSAEAQEPRWWVGVDGSVGLW